ncbi:MAG: adenosine deaminase [Chloroflexi bacterium]|nr:adenosine deaminase [Chloroflexota bacterium]
MQPSTLRQAQDNAFDLPPATAFLRAMPKAELHTHLEGAIQPATVLELAAAHGMLHTLPASDGEGLRRWFLFRDFRHFIEIYMTIQALLRRGEDFATVAYRNGEDMAAQGIRYRELTVTTFTHTHLQGKSISIEEIFAGLEDGRRWARRDFGVEMRWVIDIPRNASFKRAGGYDPFPAQMTLAHAIAGMDYGVIGLGLGGNEVGAPPEPFAHAFAQAKAVGLHSLPHAGEMVGPASVWGALNGLDAERIGHGVRAIEDPALLLHLQERQIPLEINPTSNVCLGVYASPAQHPFPHLDRMGLFVTVNSDDPPLFNTSLLAEYQLLADTFGYDEANLARIARNAFRATCAEPELKRSLLAEFDKWLEEWNAGEQNAQ